MQFICQDSWWTCNPNVQDVRRRGPEYSCCVWTKSTSHQLLVGRWFSPVFIHTSAKWISSINNPHFDMYCGWTIFCTSWDGCAGFRRHLCHQLRRKPCTRAWSKSISPRSMSRRMRNCRRAWQFREDPQLGSQFFNPTYLLLQPWPQGSWMGKIGLMEHPNIAFGNKGSPLHRQYFAMALGLDVVGLDVIGLTWVRFWVCEAHPLHGCPWAIFHFCLLWLKSNHLPAKI